MASTESDITARLISEMPPPSSTVIGSGESSQDFTNLRDRYGQPFNPETHKTDEQGIPVTIRQGNRTFLAMKRGRRNSEPSPSGLEGQVVGPSAQSYATAQALTQSIEVFMRIAFGDDGKLKSEPMDERKLLVESWAECVDYYDLPRVPPWITVLTACTIIVAPRLMQPTRIEKIKAWFKRRRNTQGASQPDSGYNGKREDEPSSPIIQ